MQTTHAGGVDLNLVVSVLLLSFGFRESNRSDGRVTGISA